MSQNHAVERWTDIFSGTRASGWRRWVATLLIAAAAFASLLRALDEPSTGWRFVASPSGGVDAIAVRANLPDLHGVTALSTSGPAPARSVAIAPVHVIESAGIHNEYSVHNQFFRDQALIWDLLQTPTVVIHHAQGLETAHVLPKTLEELGSRFWFPWVVGLLSLSVGLALWVYRPGDLAARCFMVSSLGYAFGMLCTAAWGSRLLTQAPMAWSELHVASHAASFMVGGSLCVLLWNRPTRLGGIWLPALVVGISSVSVMADAFQWVPTISLAFRLPVVLVNAMLGLIFVAQWRASRTDPAKRAQLKWFGLLLFLGLSTVFVAYAVGATGKVVNIPQNYGLASVALLFLGLVPLVTRVGLFQLEAWWPRAWLWFLGGLLVVLLDMFLLLALDLSTESALAIALAAAGWLYFPIRQAVWGRLSRGTLPATREVLPQVLDLVTRGLHDPSALRERWIHLWDEVFRPSSMDAAPSGASPGIRDDGRTLVVSARLLPALSLGLPGRGARLFSPADARRAQEICDLVSQGLASHEAWELGARSERQRIASDLHDDLGARLLSIVHTSESPRVSELAREALNDMRLAVRGLSVTAIDADGALAQWRAECVTRLRDAGIDVQWESAEPPSLQLGARMYLQLTRVLREGVNNILRHSQARHARIRFLWSMDQLTIQLEDDGQGLQETGPGTGRGLGFMRTRVESLGGRLDIEPAHPGLRLRISLPISRAPAPAAGT